MALLAEKPRKAVAGFSDLSSASPFMSKAMPVFFKNISSPETAQLLDIGPVCNENINLFAYRVKKLFVVNIFAHIGRHKKTSSHSVDIEREIDYPPESFDGITLWDLPDRLDDQDARRLGPLCNRLLKPNGVILVCACDPLQQDKRVNTFVVKEDHSVSFRPQPKIQLDIYPRKNRDLFGVLDPLIPLQSFIFRNGLREVVLKKGK